KFLGTNPDKLDDHVYSTTFEVFKSHMFVSAADESYLRNGNRAATPRLTAAQPENGSGAEATEDEAVEGGVDTRVKDLYRTLVRRLHPDLRTDGSTGVSA